MDSQKKIIDEFFIKTVKNILTDLHKELEKGEFDMWAEGLCDDLHNTEIDPATIKSIVRDFLASRLIEIDDGSSIFNS